MISDDEIDRADEESLKDDWKHYNPQMRANAIAADPELIHRLGLSAADPHVPMFEDDKWDRDDAGRFA